MKKGILCIVLECGMLSFESAECYLLRVGGFTCSLEVYHGVIWTNRMKILIWIFKTVKLYSFLSLIPWFQNRIRIVLNYWIRIRAETIRMHNSAICILNSKQNTEEFQNIEAKIPVSEARHTLRRRLTEKRYKIVLRSLASEKFLL
jgi:hypothetical protein